MHPPPVARVSLFSHFSHRVNPVECLFPKGGGNGACSRDHDLKHTLCSEIPMILIIYAHPYPQHSHANKRLIQAAGELDQVEVRSLYDLYPDFALNVEAEQQALSRASLVVWQHPMQWYSMPPLLKLWFDKVLTHGWAYGQGGHALRGKKALWAVTTGGDHHHFELGNFPDFAALAQPLEATALYCGMQWQPPFVLHGTFNCDPVTLEAAAARYHSQLSAYLLPQAANESTAALAGGTHG